MQIAIGTFITMIIPAFLFFGKVNVLIEKYKQVSALSLLVSFIGLALYFIANLNFWVLLIMLIPFFQVLAFGGSLKVFTLSYGRKPQSVSLNFQSGLAADRVFSIFVVLLMIVVGFLFFTPVLNNE